MRDSNFPQPNRETAKRGDRQEDAYVSSVVTGCRRIGDNLATNTGIASARRTMTNSNQVSRVDSARRAGRLRYTSDFGDLDGNN
jgi:hypothetical protein